MNKLLKGILALTMAFTLCACGDSGEEKDKLAQIKEQGYILSLIHI